MEIVINTCFGGFGLSDEAYEWLIKNKKWKVTKWNSKGNYQNPKADLCLMDKKSLVGKYCLVKDDRDIRINRDVIECIEMISPKKASGKYAKLKIVEIPDGIEFDINEYDGVETIHEKHKIWG